MNDVIRAMVGALAAAVAMFVVGALFWATPLSRLAFSATGEAQGAAVQVAMAANLPHTGHYLIPDTDTASGTTLFGRGPVATVDYNTDGFAVRDRAAIVGGLVQDAVVALVIAAALLGVAGRVTDFSSRFRLGVGLSAAATVLTTLYAPIFAHAPWDFAVYNLVASLAMLTTAVFVVTRWFLPRR